MRRHFALPKPVVALFFAVAIVVITTSGASAETKGPGGAGGNAGLLMTSAKANEAGTKVLVRIRWHRGLLRSAGENKRFALAVIAHQGRKKTRIGLLKRPMVNRDEVEVVPVKVNARLFKRANGVTVTATQKYDSPTDGDHLFERNAVGVRSVSGKSRGLNLRACTRAML